MWLKRLRYLSHHRSEAFWNNSPQAIIVEYDWKNNWICSKTSILLFSYIFQFSTAHLFWIIYESAENLIRTSYLFVYDKYYRNDLLEQIFILFAYIFRRHEIVRCVIRPFSEPFGWFMALWRVILKYMQYFFPFVFYRMDSFSLKQRTQFVQKEIGSAASNDIKKCIKIKNLWNYL